MAVIITVGNQKGGVAKTSTVVSLAYALANKPFNKRVLCVDCDPQGSLSTTLGTVDPTEQSRTMAMLLRNDPTLTWTHAIVRSKYSNIDLIPANIDMFDTGMALSPGDPMTFIGLKGKLNQETLDSYDYIFMDLPPNLGGPFVANAMIITDYFIIPVESASLYSIRGLDQFLTAISRVRDLGSRKMEIMGILITKHDGRTKASRVVEDTLEKQYGKTLFNTRISLSTMMGQANLQKCAVQEIYPKSVPARNYRSLAIEILERCGDETVKNIERTEPPSPEEVAAEAEMITAKPRRRRKVVTNG